MNTDQPVRADERTAAVENASLKWAWNVLVWPLLFDAMYRQHSLNEEVGDLVALICISSGVAIAYQYRYKAVVSHWPWKWRKTAIAFATSIVVAILVLAIAFFA
jgi:hypothetical protein